MLDLTKIQNIRFDNIDYGDYPDFSDAYPTDVEYNDPNTNEVRELTETEMEWFTEQTDFWWPTLYEYITGGLFI